MFEDDCDTQTEHTMIDSDRTSDTNEVGFNVAFQKLPLTSCTLEFIMMNEVIDWIAIYSVMLWMPCLEKL